MRSVERRIAAACRRSRQSRSSSPSARSISSVAVPIAASGERRSWLTTARISSRDRVARSASASSRPARSACSRSTRSASCRRRETVSCAATRASSSSAENGLTRYPSAPLSNPSMAASSPARADSSSTGMVRVRSSARSARTRPRPSSPGIITSDRIRSGRRPPRGLQRARAVAHRLDGPPRRQDARRGSRACRGCRRRPGSARPRGPPPRPVTGSSARATATPPRGRRARRSGSAPAAARPDPGRAGARYVRRPRRHADGEGGALAGGARDLDRAAVQRDQLLDEREPDPRALVAAAARALHAVEAIEDPRQLVGGDPDPRVRHRQLDAGAPPGERDAHRAREGELERVGEQVQDDLLPARRVDVDRLGEGRAVHHEREAHALHRGVEAAREVGGERGQIGGDEERPAPAPPRSGRSRAGC